MTISPTQAAEFLAAHDRYLILTHVRPDGDTVGCAAALCRALRALGKTAHVLPNSEIIPLFSPYLEGLLAPEDLLPDTVVSVDMAARSLFPDNALPPPGGSGHRPPPVPGVFRPGDLSGRRSGRLRRADVRHPAAAGPCHR